MFVLIDSLDKNFYQRYKNKLDSIHQELLKKLDDVLVVGNKDSQITENRFDDLKSMYQFIAKHSKNKDIVICDAFAGMLSIKDSQSVLDYMNDNAYDVCLTENLPEGLVPMTISKDFINELHTYIEEDQKIVSTFKELINWEYKGIDVGVYLSSSMLIMERIDFLPVNKGAIEYILENATKDFSLENISSIQLLRTYPQYIAIEISSKSDEFCNRKFSEEEMDIDTFRKIITEIDELAPEAWISVGVWGDPFTHSKFTEVMHILNTIPNKVLIECRSIFLSEQCVQQVLSRPNTELIFDVSFTTEETFKTHKKSPYTLAQTVAFIKSLPEQKHIWVRLTRTQDTEGSIKHFLKEWKDHKMIVTKADTFVGSKVVDLAPINRHACYALRREMTILNNGDVLLCRQSHDILGSIKTKSLLSLWNQNEQPFQEHLQQNYNTCKECKACDDWWIWN